MALLATQLAVAIPVSLIWHRLRCYAGDWPGDPGNLLRGLKVGAVLELDLRATADHYPVIFHDTRLEWQSSGYGSVADCSLAEFQSLHYQDGDRRGPPLLALADIAHSLTTLDVHPNTRLQLDLKLSYDQLSPAFIAAVQRYLTPHQERFILGGSDAQAVARLAEGLPVLVQGFDPKTYFHGEPPQDAATYQRLVTWAITEAPSAQVVYLNHRWLLMALAQGVDVVAAWHRTARQVVTWTVDADQPDVEQQLCQLVACGVDGIITNTPIALARCWQNRTG